MVSLCLILLTLAANQAAPDTRVLSGVVVDDANTALQDAVVTLTPVQPRTPLPSSRTIETFSDAQGRFFFPDLPAGRYRVAAGREGYWGSTAPNGNVDPTAAAFVDIDSTQAPSSIRLVLYAEAPTGVSGRVTDTAGQPIPNIRVA